jgi:beta-glucosidase
MERNKMESILNPIYLDPTQPVEARVEDLISRLTLAEKVSQMVHNAPAIPRLGIPAYNWWNEALHGVARAGLATVFPQAIGLAATWNPALILQVASVISDEGRAKHHQVARQGMREIYTGLTFWSPNINLFRDPRWGRGQETYGEDPVLTGQIGKAFVKGLQGDHPHYLKTAAGAKHFAVHSGPEAQRHRFNATVSQRDLRQTYLPAFKALVQDARVETVMGAYNRVNGEPCCASPTLLERILREEWGFQGHVVSDCGAIDDIHTGHQAVGSKEEAAALAVQVGCDLNCGNTYPALLKAISQGLVRESEVDRAISRLFSTRFRLGLFDPDVLVPFASIPFEVVDSAAHRQLALETARQSLVLLKNEGGFLPINGEVKSIAVIGPNAADGMVLRGNYFGEPSIPVSILNGISQRAGTGTQVNYARGCGIRGGEDAEMAEAVALADQADLVLAVLGLSQLIEGEEGQDEGTPTGLRSFGDRTELCLPGRQEELLQKLAATGKPLALVLLNGSAVALNWAQGSLQVRAILEAWYPGQAGGTAVAEALFGDFNPGGRLPVTFYQSASQLPPFEEYAMEGRTYRYFRSSPLYPFGFGLSYTRFEYSGLLVQQAVSDDSRSLIIKVKVTNIGKWDGDEVAQLYVQDVEASVPVPACELKRFTRLHLDKGASAELEFTLNRDELDCFDDEGQPYFEPGVFKVWVGGHSPALYGSVVELEPMVSSEVIME